MQCDNAFVPTANDGGVPSFQRYYEINCLESQDLLAFLAWVMTDDGMLFVFTILHWTSITVTVAASRKHDHES